MAKIIRIKTVTQAIGLSRSSVYRLVNLGVFPKPFKLGISAIGWDVADIDSWIEGRKTGIPVASVVH